MKAIALFLTCCVMIAVYTAFVCLWSLYTLRWGVRNWISIAREIPGEIRTAWVGMRKLESF